MSRIFVSGGGNAKDSYLLDQEFVNSFHNSKILYIPVGLEHGIAGYDGCFDWLTRTLSVHAKKELDITMWINLAGKDKEDITKYKAIYIGGALNTYKLMSMFSRFKIDKILRKFLESGDALYGGSSGGVVFGQNISTFKEEKDVEGIGEKGLDLVSGYSIFSHLTDDKISEVVQFAREKNSSVIAIPENSGIVLENGVGKVVGYSKIAIIYQGDKKIVYLDPGASFKL